MNIINDMGLLIENAVYLIIGMIALRLIIDRIRDTIVAVVDARANAEIQVIHAQSESERALFANEDEAEQDTEETPYPLICKHNRNEEA